MLDKIFSIITYSEIYSLIWLGLKIIACIVPLILCVAYLTYAERKIIAAIQLRRGPSKTGLFGLMQPIADAIKLLFKETVIPLPADKKIFMLAPVATFTLSMAGWAVIPFEHGLCFANINVGMLYLLSVSSLAVYGIIMAGWASNSKYAFLGGIRSAAQIISYEISLGLVVVTVLIAYGSLNLSEIIAAQATMPLWIKLLLSPILIVFFISILAETNRLPFDLPEAESELVAGYNVEYSSMAFALFFLGEYANMILMSTITTILFLGGYLPIFSTIYLKFVPGFIWLSIKVCFVLFCFLWVRATLPRYRYDQLMYLGWKRLLPFSLLWMILVAIVLLYTNNLPNTVVVA